jgi:hypothetical protein
VLFLLKTTVFFVSHGKNEPKESEIRVFLLYIATSPRQAFVGKNQSCNIFQGILRLMPVQKNAR